MKIILFGAAGGTGAEILKQALRDSADFILKELPVVGS